MLSRLFHILLAAVAISSVVTAAPRGAWAEVLELDAATLEEICGTVDTECVTQVTQFSTELGYSVMLTPTVSPTGSPTGTAPVVNSSKRIDAAGQY